MILDSVQKGTGWISKSKGSTQTCTVSLEETCALECLQGLWRRQRGPAIVEALE